MKIYQVGGAVRDKLLGLPVKDRDWLVVGSSPEEMQALGFTPVGQDFPVFLHPETHEEYALARIERKIAPGYTGFSFHTSADVSLEDDLRRRDLTINAMAEDEHGNLIDPFAGKQDLENGILRHVSPAFVEDPLRVLRVARFAARFDFKLSEQTLTLMQEISQSGELDTLVAERVWAELEKALAEQYPVRFFEVLQSCAALENIFPEIDKLFGIPQPEQYHPEIDSGVHTMMVLQLACTLTDETIIRFAALVHDVGKGLTPKAQWPSHRGHEERSVEIIHKMCDRYRIPNKYRQLAIIVARYHLDCHRIGEMHPHTILKKLEAIDALRRPERFEQFLIACEADARGRKGMENNAYPQAKFFRKAYEAAKGVDTQDLVDKGVEGHSMAEEIRQLRIAAIRKIKT